MKRKAIFTIIAIACYSLLLVGVYLAVSFALSNWNVSWFILQGGFTLPVAIVAAALVFKFERRKTHYARIFVPFAIMLTDTFIFLCLHILADINRAYFTFLVAVIIMLTADAIIAFRLGRFWVPFVLLYILIVAALMYVMLAITGYVSWGLGWLIIIGGVVIDILLLFFTILAYNNARVQKLVERSRQMFGRTRQSAEKKWQKKNMLPAELWDKMQYMFRNYYDRMVHAEITYDGIIDIETLKKAITLVTDANPVLHSAFVPSPARPFWKIAKYKIEDILSVGSVKDAAEWEEKSQEFLTQCIPANANVQFKIAVLEYDGKSRLLAIVNHMCMDGGGYKRFLSDISAAYNAFIAGKKPVLPQYGSRTYDEVYKDLPPQDRKAAKSLFKNVSKKTDYNFPFLPEGGAQRSFISKVKIEAEDFAKIKAFGKSLGATINDIVLAAYVHKLYDFLQKPEGEELVVSCAVDLRRHIKDTSHLGYTNHTAYMYASIPQKGQDILDTIKLAKAANDVNKGDKYLGLHGLPLLNLGFTLFPHFLAEQIVKMRYANPRIAMSNIGLIDTDSLQLGELKVEDAYMSGAVKYKPFVLLSVTSANNTLMLSMCVRGKEEDKKMVDGFLKDVAECLLGIV